MHNHAILYTTGCAKCGILKKKLDLAGVPYTENGDVDEMQRLGMTEAPALFADGVLMGFSEAVRWLSGQKE